MRADRAFDESVGDAILGPVPGDTKDEPDPDRQRRAVSLGRGRPVVRPTGQQVKADVVVSGLSSPVDVTSAGDGSGRLFVVEQPGMIRIDPRRGIGR